MYNIMLFVSLGTAPIANGTATVSVNGLQCGVTYTIVAGGTLNGDLVGARSSHETVTTAPCPIDATSNFCSYMMPLHYIAIIISM